MECLLTELNLLSRPAFWSKTLVTYTRLPNRKCSCLLLVLWMVIQPTDHHIWRFFKTGSLKLSASCLKARRTVRSRWYSFFSLIGKEMGVSEAGNSTPSTWHYQWIFLYPAFYSPLTTKSWAVNLFKSQFCHRGETVICHKH